LFDTYIPALYVSGSFCILAALLVMTMARPLRMKTAEAAA